MRDYRRRSGLEELGLTGSVAGAARWIGLDRLGDTLDRVARQAEPLSLDGLLALWQPALEN